MKLKATRLFDKQQLVRVGKRLCLSTIVFFTLPIALVEAQVTPDESLSTNVEQQGENQLNINGGEREGNNLFHSFQEFSVPEGLEAVFENAPDIENIFTRITGESASAINGILRTQGGANFFLVNPNGIVFGESAQLDVGGSFIATTADSVQFEDGTEFIAKDSGEQPILTVSVPIGLQFDGNNGAITVNGDGSQITPYTSESPTAVKDSTIGLSVDSGETLGFIGGDVNLNGGTITAPEGRIELGSVGSGSVSLTQVQEKLTFGFDNTTINRNIFLNNLSLLDSSGEGQGAISLTGNNINITNGSHILIQNTDNTPTGDISINATDSLTVSGTADDGNVSSAISAEALGTAKGADITISTSDLLLKNATAIRAVTFTDAVGGNITINATESVQLLENTSVNLNREAAVTSIIIASALDSGDGGNIQVSTPQLRILDGGYISSSTIGTGRGGNLSVNTSEIELIGLNSDQSQRSILSASSFNAGDAGSVDLTTTKLRVIDGAQIASGSFASGNSGSVTVNASSSVEVSGVGNDSPSSPSTIRASANFPTSALKERYGLPDAPSSFSGNVRINTPVLNVNSGATINVKNDGTGDAGTLSIDADLVNLNNSGSITAASASGAGGNIDLDTDNLQIDEGSQITATAQNNGDGGNITINTNTLIAKKNSQVTANAFAGRGGNLDINAEGLFLFDSPSNIFSASSELGIDGTIQINTPDINLQRELEQLELELLTTSEAIANSCLARSNQQPSFTVNNGRGLPKSPDSNYSDLDSTLTGISSLPTNAKQPLEVSENNRKPNTSMLPAEKMVKTQDGRIFLVAAPQKPESLFCPKN
jgi:filamentous hemagglutinin family protein